MTGAGRVRHADPVVSHDTTPPDVPDSPARACTVGPRVCAGPPRTPPTPLATREELCGVAGADDAFARLDPPRELRGWACDGAVAVVRRAGRRPPSLFVWGGDVGPLLDSLAGDLPSLGVAGISVPRGQESALTSRFTVLGGGDWDWMWSTRTPDAASSALGEGLDLVDLDDTRDAAEIVALAAENPRFEGFPGTGVSEVWLGVRDTSGALVACGAIQRLPSGVAHLGGILVTSRLRRRGLGSAVTAALTARALAEDGVCTLGMYADNAPARSVYASLGYRVDKAWASRAVSLR